MSCTKHLSRFGHDSLLAIVMPGFPRRPRNSSSPLCRPIQYGTGLNPLGSVQLGYGSGKVQSTQPVPRDIGDSAPLLVNRNVSQQPLHSSEFSPPQPHIGNLSSCRHHAWVVYVACAAFFFAGITIIAHENRLRRAHFWLAFVTASALITPGTWIAFGPGVRACSVSIPFFSFLGSDFLCRGAFGLGTFIGAAVLIWVVLRASHER